MKTLLLERRKLKFNLDLDSTLIMGNNNVEWSSREAKRRNQRYESRVSSKIYSQVEKETTINEKWMNGCGKKPNGFGVIFVTNWSRLVREWIIERFCGAQVDRSAAVAWLLNSVYPLIVLEFTTKASISPPRCLVYRFTTETRKCQQWRVNNLNFCHT